MNAEILVEQLFKIWNQHYQSILKTQKEEKGITQAKLVDHIHLLESKFNSLEDAWLLHKKYSQEVTPTKLEIDKPPHDNFYS